MGPKSLGQRSLAGPQRVGQHLVEDHVEQLLDRLQPNPLPANNLEQRNRLEQACAWLTRAAGGG